MIMNIINKIKPIILNAASMAPLPVGIVIGYFGHGPIHLMIDIAMSTIKLVFKI